VGRVVGISHSVGRAGGGISHGVGMGDGGATAAPPPPSTLVVSRTKFQLLNCIRDIIRLTC